MLPPPQKIRFGISVAALALLALPARAQYLQTYFPGTVPGFDQQLGVTVLSRLRPGYEAQGVQAGAFTIRPRLDESFGYDTNPAGVSNSQGSWLLRTTPSVTANSNWSNTRLGAAIGADNYHYFDTTNQDRTDWTGAVGAGTTLRQDDDLSIAYAHLALHENADSVGGIASSVPTPYDVNDIRLAYKLDLGGRFTLTPNLDVRTYQFGNTVVGTTPTSQSYRNRTVFTGALTGRYALTDRTGALVVLAGSGSNYTDNTPGAPSNNSRTALMLVGLDDLLGTLIRYRILVGAEIRTFTAAVYQTHTAPVAEASLIWTPTGLTTITGDLAHTIEDPSSEGTAGYEFTLGTLTIDHEFRRDVLLQGRSAVQSAHFLQGGGTQTAYGLGAGITYLVNRNISIALNYDYLHQSGTNSGNYATPNAFTLTSTNTLPTPIPTLGPTSTGAFQRHLVLLSVHFGI